MIVRIARVKVGHCQTPHTRKPDSKESGFLLSAGMGVKNRIRRGIALDVILDRACSDIPSLDANESNVTVKRASIA